MVNDNGWRKSRHSQGASNCVEAAAYRKSSHSNPDNCLEAGQGAGVVAVRDTKDKGAGPVLEFSPAAWARFMEGVRA